MQKKIAIIGAGYLQLPLVNKALEMGVEAHCFAVEKGAVCKEVCSEFYPISTLNKEEIFEVCKRIGMNGIVSIASDIAVPTMNYISERLGLIGNSMESSIFSTDKFLMRQRLSLAQLPVPKYLLAEDSQQEIKTDLLTFPLIVKPVDRSGSLGVSKVDKHEDLSKTIKLALRHSLSNRAIVEEFIQGTEISVEVLSVNSEHRVLAFTDKITSGKPHFVELEHHQPSSVSQNVKEKITLLIPQILKALDITWGASHHEFLIKENEDIYITEVGARMGGDFIGSHLVKFSTGFDYLKGVISVSIGETVDFSLTEGGFSGVIYFPDEESFNKFDLANPVVMNYGVIGSDKQLLGSSRDRYAYVIYQGLERLTGSQIV